MKFKDSALAHKYLDGLKGIEIGGSAHNPFHLNTINVDFTDDMETVFKKAEFELCGEKLKVDVVADGCDLPFEDESYDFVLSSHVIEHIFDPIGAMKEWLRVIKTGGYVFTICPRWQQVPGEVRPVTELKELIARHKGTKKKVNRLENPVLKQDRGLSIGLVKQIVEGHLTVFDLELFVAMCEYLKLNVVEKLPFDDKVGNGFTVLIKK